MNRRTLLRQGTGLLAAAGASRLVGQEGTVNSGAASNGDVSFPPIDRPSEAGDKPPNPSPEADRVGFAVVGLGRLSVEQILPAFGSAKRARLVALVSGTPAKAALLAAQYGISAKSVYDYASFDRIRENHDIQVVYIVLPNALHREYAVRAAGAGKHVLCEKPMAANVGEATAMIDGCKRADRKLMIAYRMQYEPSTIELIRQARSGELGTLTAISAMNSQAQGDPKQWRLKRSLAGGGALYDIGIYCQNAARYITGEEPVEVSARMFSHSNDPRFKEVEETVAWSMRFPGGCVANLMCSYGAHESRTLSVYGTDAHATMDPAFGYHGQRLKIGRKVNETFQEETELTSSPANQFSLELDHMADCILGNRTPRTPGEEGLRDHIIMEAVYKSASTGQVVLL